LSHANRSKTNPSPFRNPTAEEVIQLRQSAGMSQAEAAKSVHASRIAWSQWETGERSMHPVFWRLFRIAVSAKTVGRVTAHLYEPDDSFTWIIKDAEKRGFLGIIAGPSDGRWACFHVTSVGEPRRRGLNGCYEHRTMVEAMAAFEQLLDD
jgi:DNA-binding XRE family transcriptional regulator